MPPKRKSPKRHWSRNNYWYNNSDIFSSLEARDKRDGFSINHVGLLVRDDGSFVNDGRSFKTIFQLKDPLQGASQLDPMFNDTSSYLRLEEDGESCIKFLTDNKEKVFPLKILFPSGKTRGHWKAGEIIIDPDKSTIYTTYYDSLSTNSGKIRDIENLERQLETLFKSFFQGRRPTFQHKEFPLEYAQEPSCCGPLCAMALHNLKTRSGDRVWDGIKHEDGRKKDAMELRIEDEELVMENLPPEQRYGFLRNNEFRSLGQNNFSNLFSAKPYQETWGSEEKKFFIYSGNSGNKNNHFSVPNDSKLFSSNKDVYETLISLEPSSSEYTKISNIEQSIAREDRNKADKKPDINRFFAQTLTEALKKANNDTSFYPEEITAIILVAIRKNGFTGKTDEELQSELEKLRIPTMREINKDFIHNARKFSTAFQKYMKQNDILTGNNMAKNHNAGFRLKRLSVDHAEFYCKRCCDHEGIWDDIKGKFDATNFREEEVDYDARIHPAETFTKPRGESLHRSKLETSRWP